MNTEKSKLETQQEQLDIPVVIHCPECNGTNIEDPHYNDYFCLDCYTAFD
jgi:cytochrome c-type biogenesis protein CcmH/NrfF